MQLHEERMINWIKNDLEELRKRIPTFITNASTTTGFLMLYSSVAYQLAMREVELSDVCFEDMMIAHMESVTHLARHIAKQQNSRINTANFYFKRHEDDLN